jgi:crotonobetainyl-CoA:carnitine CoA-transferase CaiB-like acyl-CoA transferase
LKHLEGREVFLRLVRTADVAVGNFRRGKLAKLGLTDMLRKVNNQIIVAPPSAYGSTGPRGSLGGFDNTIQATSGVMDRTGVKTAASFTDYASGYALACAMSAAVMQRLRFGNVQRIHASMFDGALQMISPEVMHAMRCLKSKHSKAGLKWYVVKDGKLMLGRHLHRDPMQNYGQR